MARPMVVGDRLWLFSQAPNGPASVQSMMLNNGPMPIPPLRSYPSPSCHGSTSSRSPILESARNALLARGQPLNYGLPKTMPPHHAFPSSGGGSPFRPLYDNSTYKFNPYLSPTTSPSTTHNNSSLQINTKLPVSHQSVQPPFGSKSSNPIDSSELYLQMKYGLGHTLVNRPLFNGHSSSSADHLMMPIDYPSSAVEEPSAGNNGLAELERAFGDRRIEEASSPGKLSPTDYGDAKSRSSKNVRNVVDDGCNDPSASNSDIDCEETEDDELDV